VHAATIADGQLRWQEHPDPAPGGGDVVVAVRAAGLNGADRLQVAGFYPAPPGSPPDIPGLELAGEVVEVGAGVDGTAVGDRVMAVVGGGGQAERCVVPAEHLLAVPPAMPWAEAGGFPEAFTTAHDALVTQCGMAAGDRVCVHGAAGGVGSAGVQLAAAMGCEVVATVRNPLLRDAVAALGDGVTAVDPADFVDHGPFDVVLELVGGPNLADDVRSLATGGRIAIIGVGAGGRAELDLLALMGKRGRIHGSTLRARSRDEKAAVAAAMRRDVLPLLERGAVRVPVEATYPMADAEAAYERFAAGAKLGKVVLTT
jgi:NADPH:quinone reductase-like Zn-dependent oxidoreductase